MTYWARKLDMAMGGKGTKINYTIVPGPCGIAIDTGDIWLGYKGGGLSMYHSGVYVDVFESQNDHDFPKDAECIFWYENHIFRPANNHRIPWSTNRYKIFPLRTSIDLPLAQDNINNSAFLFHFPQRRHSCWRIQWSTQLMGMFCNERY